MPQSIIASCAARRISYLAVRFERPRFLEDATMPNETIFPTIAGTRIRMFRGGQGEQVVFLHGAAGLSVWTPFFQALAERYSVNVPEHPGFGQSDNPSWLNSVANLSMFYLDFLESQNLNDVHLIGNSLGGWIAADLATRNTNRIASLTLIGPAGLKPREPSDDIFRWTYEESIKRLFHDQAIATRMLSQAPTSEQVANLIKNQTTVTRIAANPHLHDPHLALRLHWIKVPTHILWGAQDRVIPASTAALWTEVIPRAKLTIVENAGHLPHAEQADVTSNEVKTFLSRAARRFPLTL
jgi:pimeloyl-ACP methyl ester carboxylesterase